MKVEAKAVKYFSTISIPGISSILTEDNYLFKLFWMILILLIFALGFWNISLAVNDYYNYDVITNIERVEPSSVTFPAITICTENSYKRDHYKNGKITGSTFIKAENISKIRRFIKNAIFLETISNVSNYLDSFKIPYRDSEVYDCFRINGATNKSVELITTNSTKDFLRITLDNFYTESISNNDFYIYSLAQLKYYVYISNNYLNSFLFKIDPLELELNNFYTAEISKESIEVKLPEPFNPCKEYLVNKPYFQSNCVEPCISKEIKKKLNCTLSLEDKSLKSCARNPKGGFQVFIKEFYEFCLKECPESCFSEKFTIDFTKRVLFNFTTFQFSLKDLSSLNISQIPKTDLFTFINNIGGGLGLFMGIAFPNIIEFIQFIVEIISLVIS